MIFSKQCYVVEMGEPLSLMYGIDLQTRCLVGVPAEQERTLFLVGTLSLKQDNQLCMLEVDDDWLQISKRSFAHPAGEVWHLASSPLRADIAATCHSCWNGELKYGATLWKIDSESGSLSTMATFQPQTDFKKCSSFEFSPDGQKAAVTTDKTVHFVDVESSLKITKSSPTESKGNINAIAWNPHSTGSTLALACDAAVRAIDVRSLENVFAIKDANPPTVRNLDFNPNVQYTVATCGDDCRIALWDTRKTTEPLKTLHDHSHWVWCVRFNPIHDQLILSGGSDARLFLNSVASLSSDSIQATDVTTEDIIANDSITQRQAPLSDERLEKVEEHEDSIYACVWAGNDPWVFASLSFDGRVIVSRVKRHHKYAILRL
ncbi:Protein TSSC1 [Toxocara canis]|uniref:Protein TSSC1 n=1 Tax=Toxocara canis TaxID=6265 RepID=A0A0B2VGR8_TOXCA|nr:Protein TSSC1 [Toxocara canis]